jgi:hypothetical protein
MPAISQSFNYQPPGIESSHLVSPLSQCFRVRLGGHSELYSSDTQLPTAYRALMNPESFMTGRSIVSLSVSEICARVNQRAENAVVERRAKAFTDKSTDQDRGKGATEQDSQNEGGNTSMGGQLGHRDDDAELKNADSDLSG